jgi:hypothetical protein
MSEPCRTRLMAKGWACWGAGASGQRTPFGTRGEAARRQRGSQGACTMDPPDRGIQPQAWHRVNHRPRNRQFVSTRAGPTQHPLLPEAACRE